MAGVGVPSAPSAPMKCEAWTMDEPGRRTVTVLYRITSNITVTEVFRGIKHEKRWRSFDAGCLTMTPRQTSFLCARVFITFSFGRTFRSGLRPELQ